MVDLNVDYIAQQYDFDCWYAALRMLVKFRVGPTAEPIGYEIAETEGMTQQSLRDNFRCQAVAHGLNARAGTVQYPPRGLNANEFVPSAQRTGLVHLCCPLSTKITRKQVGGRSQYSKRCYVSMVRFGAT